MLDAVCSPNFDDDIDVAAALACVPADATIKGMFVNGLIELLPAGADLGEPALSRRRIPFKDEPLVDFMRVSVAVARALYPELPLRRALREVGRATYRAFFTSLTGRVVFGVLGADVEKLIRATTKAYGLTQSHGRADVVESSAHHCVLHYKGLFQFLDCLEIGVVEEAVTSCGLVPSVEVVLETSSSGRMNIRF